MHVEWGDLFKKARYGPPVDATVGPWRTLEDPGELAASDLVANEVAYILKSDATLRKVFEDRFDRLPWIIHNDTREFPRCSVHLSSATNSERPTSTRVEQVSVFIGTLWDLAYVAPAEDGAATVATVQAHVKRVLTAQKNRALVVTYNGSEVQLAAQMTLGAEGYGVLKTLDDRPFGIVHEVEAIYEVRIDRDTARITTVTSLP